VSLALAEDDEHQHVFSYHFSDVSTSVSKNGSVTGWLEQLKAGSSAPLQPLWERYFTRLVDFAQRRLRGHAIAAVGGSDVALSAFQSFHDGVRRGRFPRLEDRNDLWQVLLMLTRQKVLNLIARESCEKHGGRRVQHLSALVGGPLDPEEGAFATLLSHGPTPEFAAHLAEEYQHLLDLLNDEVLSSVAVWKMEGHTNAEIAARLGRSESTVERKLGLIRRIWSREGTCDAPQSPGG
jgi:DNA-directed RNA polymerase specialized sigma24 family protein